MGIATNGGALSTALHHLDVLPQPLRPPPSDNRSQSIRSVQILLSCTALFLCATATGQHYLDKYKGQHEQLQQHSRSARRSRRNQRINNAIVLGEALFFSALSASVGASHAVPVSEHGRACCSACMSETSRLRQLLGMYCRRLVGALQQEPDIRFDCHVAQPVLRLVLLGRCPGFRVDGSLLGPAHQHWPAALLLVAHHPPHAGAEHACALT